MEKQSRRDAIRDYKERKVPAGIFAVRCAVSGEVWVGVSRNLGQQKNGTWFGLKTGGHPNRALQAAWTIHGEGAFTYEVLETLADDLSALGQANALKEGEAAWLAKLSARKAAG